MIRPARPDDAKAISDLESECFGGNAWSRSQVASDLVHPSHAVVVAEQDGRMLGYAVITAAGEVADLTRIAVDEGARRRGIASGLLAAATTIAVQRDAGRMLVEVAAGNLGAQDFYRARGFSEIARRGNYYADGDDALVLARALG